MSEGAEGMVAPGHASGDVRRSGGNYAKWTYPAIALLLLVSAFLGFQAFYLHGKAYPDREIAPPIRTLVILHGVGMTAWISLFVVQPVLIATSRRKVHMMLGKFGAVLAAVVFVLGFRLGVASAQVTPPEMTLWDLAPRQFMAVSLVAITSFAVFVALGIWQRRKPAIHRAMMLLATLSAVPAALDRIDFIKNLYENTLFGDIFGPFFAGLFIGLVFIGLRYALTRRVERPLILGFAALTLISVVTMQLAKTELWMSIANVLAG